MVIKHVIEKKWFIIIIIDSDKNRIESNNF
jgi:hypothetical protein